MILLFEIKRKHIPHSRPEDQIKYKQENLFVIS